MKSLKEMITFFNEAGESKTKMPLKSTILLGLFAGGLIGLGYIAFLAAIQIIGGNIGLFVGAMLFPMALLSILVLGGELVTANAMIIGISLVNKKVTLSKTLTNWLILIIANFIGAALVASTIYFLGTFDASKEVIINIVNTKLSLDPLNLIVSGIMCSIFVAIAAWMFSSAKSGAVKIAAMWVPIAVFAMIGFQHCVANTFVYTLGLLWGVSDIVTVAINLCFIIGLIKPKGTNL